MDRLTFNQSPIDESYTLTGPGEPNIGVLTFRDNFKLETQAFPEYTISKCNKDIIIINNEIRLAQPSDSNIIPAGTEIRIDSNGISFK